MNLCANCGIKERAKNRTLCYPCYGGIRRGTMEVGNHPRSFEVEESNQKILLLDIETTPTIAYTWGLFKQNIGVNQIIETGEIMCFSYKWLGDSDTQFVSEWNDGREKMIRKAWELLNETDSVIHYYGSQFDIPWLNRSFLELGLTPPSPFKQIDLKTAVAKQFRFTSNKLQHISTELGLEGKIEHQGFSLWTDCIARKSEALDLMEAYNRRDVELLQELYLILLPWIPGLPSRHLFDGMGGCPACGKDELVEAGIAYTRVSRYAQWKCELCGSYFRSSKRLDGIQLQQIAR